MNLQQHRRAGSRKPLWEEMPDLHVKRNVVLHQVASASLADAEQALAVAEVMMREVFPLVMTKLGLHLHEEPRICDSPKCAAHSAVV